MSEISLEEQLKMIHEDLIRKFGELKKENESIKLRLCNIESKLGKDTVSKKEDLDSNIKLEEKNIALEEKILDPYENQLVPNDTSTADKVQTDAEKKETNNEGQKEFSKEEIVAATTVRQLDEDDKQSAEPRLNLIKEKGNEIKSQDQKINSNEKMQEESYDEDDNFNNFDLANFQDQVSVSLNHSFPKFFYHISPKYKYLKIK